MNGLKTTKYMDAFSVLGYIIGFGMIIIYSISNVSWIFPVAGVILIFVFRFIGYGLDRIVELKEEKTSKNVFHCIIHIVFLGMTLFI